jgi:hypothetical protein
MPAKPLLDLAKHYQASDEMAEGKWVELDDCNMVVHVARAASPRFHKALASQQRKYGLNKNRRRQDADKVLKASIGTIARSIFLGFKGPNGERSVAIGDEEIEDSIDGRERILTEFPDLREEIVLAAEALADEFNEEAQAVGKD